VFQVFLQVLDDGRATDAQGRTVSFKNAVIIMTSNLGSAEIFEALGGPALVGGGGVRGRGAGGKGGARARVAGEGGKKRLLAAKAEGGAVVVAARRGPAPSPSPTAPAVNGNGAAPASDDAAGDAQLLLLNGNGAGAGGANGSAAAIEAEADGNADADAGDAGAGATGAGGGDGGESAGQAAARRTLYADVKRRVMDAVRGHFRPEFVNRVDDFIVFHPLAADEIRAIVAMRAAALVARLGRQQRIGLALSRGAVDAVARVGYDPVFGARPVKRALQRELQTPMALALLRGDFREGDRVVAEAVGEAMPAQAEGGAEGGAEEEGGGGGGGRAPPFFVVGDGSGSMVATGSVGTTLRLRLEHRPPPAAAQAEGRVAALREQHAAAAKRRQEDAARKDEKTAPAP
jgi:ATP-dependent Clp protease ATP-binding subunit ClpB